MRRGIAGTAAAIVVWGAAAWITRASDVESVRGHTVEVRQVDVGYAVGKPGLKARLVLVTGEAVEYPLEDSAEGEAFLRLTDLFINGRARMLAEIDGRTVLGVHVSGP